MNPLETIHGQYVHTRRVRILAQHIAPLLPQGSTVLDVGCGDGLLDEAILSARPDLSIRGLEVQPRANARIPVDSFDGQTIALPDDAVDAVMFIDVLHHTADPLVLLREAARVSRKMIIIKDHFREGLLANTTLRFMDRVGNKRHGVPLPYRYWTEAEWTAAYAELDLDLTSSQRSLRLYPWPASMLFDRSLHFIAQLSKRREHR